MEWSYDFDDLVVLGSLVGFEVVLELRGVFGNVRALGGVEVIPHAGVVREQGGRGPDLGSHVADGRHAGAAEGLDSRAGVLDDRACATLDGEDACDLENDVCWVC